MIKEFVLAGGIFYILLDGVQVLGRPSVNMQGLAVGILLLAATSVFWCGKRYAEAMGVSPGLVCCDALRRVWSADTWGDTVSGYLYEKDLVAMKYAILISTRHDRLVREIAGDLGISPQNLRRYMIERFDMILMENLPARYEAGKAETGNDAPLADALGRVIHPVYPPA